MIKKHIIEAEFSKIYNKNFKRRGKLFLIFDHKCAVDGKVQNT